jgi:hypothetical protein
VLKHGTRQPCSWLTFDDHRKKVRTPAKLLIGLCSVVIVCATFVLFQERRARSTVESVRAALVVGDSKEKVERVMRGHGLQPEIGSHGRSYTARVWVPLRQDVSITVVLNGHWEVDMIVIVDSQRH